MVLGYKKVNVHFCCVVTLDLETKVLKTLNTKKVLEQSLDSVLLWINKFINSNKHRRIRSTFRLSKVDE